tara:strand:+ start:1741 stop:2718 length:978 start_codon:yes stop_codon:yes gene_type:complete
MGIPPVLVCTAKKAWNWQWQQLMNGLAPSDKSGNYKRPKSQKQQSPVLLKSDLFNRTSQQLPVLVIGRSCPWAHRTWLVYHLRGLDKTLNLLIAQANSNEGRWRIDPPFLKCKSLTALYKLCNCPPSNRATVPALIDPENDNTQHPQLLGNESAQLVEVLNQWPTQSKDAPDLAPKRLNEEILEWERLIQNRVNDGVYKCGFARNQNAYDKACNELFDGLTQIEKSLTKKGPWLCGEELTLADIRLFPTLIRWEIVYAPLFGCSKKSLKSFPSILDWRKKFFKIANVKDTCDSEAWRNDYYGALFPLRPSNIVPKGPNLENIVNQ